MVSCQPLPRRAAADIALGVNMVHIADPELVKAVFGGDNDVLRAGGANATILEPLVGPHSVLVLDGPEHLRQRKPILPAFHGDRMRAWESSCTLVEHV